MQVVLQERVKIALGMLNKDDRDRVETWFGYFQNWADDPFVKSRSVVLELRDVSGQPVQMFRTSTDIRIFYTVDIANKKIDVIDIATKDAILSFGGVRVGA